MAEFENGILSTLSVYSVVQDLSADATTLLSIVYSIIPSELNVFIERFARLLIRGSVVNALATSEIISELLTLELDRSLWQLGSSKYFMRGEGTICQLIDSIANQTISSPDGNYVGHLVGICSPMCEQIFDRSASTYSEDDQNLDQASPLDFLSGRLTPTGVSFAVDATSMEDFIGKLNSSELAGLAAAEQFLQENNSNSLNSANQSMSGDTPRNVNLPSALSPQSSYYNGRNSVQNFSFLLARSQMANERESNLREAIDYFIKVESSEITPAEYADVSEETLTSYVDAIVDICFRILDVSFSLINEWPESLRRALWTAMRAISGTGFTEATVVMNDDMLYTIEYTAMATIVAHRVICPLIRSIPSIIYHRKAVDENTTQRFTWISTLMEKTSYAENYNVDKNSPLQLLNARCPELTERWVTFFLKITKFHQIPETLWPIPAGQDTLNSSTGADQNLAFDFFEICDRCFVTYLQTSMLLRPLTEPLHATVWMRFTRYLSRLKLGKVTKSFDVQVTTDKSVLGVTKKVVVEKTPTDQDLLNGTTRVYKTNVVHFVSPKLPAVTIHRGFSTNSLMEAGDDDTGVSPVEDSKAFTRTFDPETEPETIEHYEMMEEILTYARLTFHSVKNNLLLSNFCSVIGCDEEGAAVIVLYGDLLSCYLTNFAQNEENLERFIESCPKFFEYRMRYFAHKKELDPDNKYNEWCDGDSIAHIYFLIDMCIQLNVRSNNFYLIFLTESVNAKQAIDRNWVKEGLRFLPRKYRECCKEVVFVRSRMDDTLHYESGFLNFFSKVSVVDDMNDLPYALPNVTTYLPISPFDYNRALITEEERRKKLQKSKGDSGSRESLNGAPETPTTEIYGARSAERKPSFLHNNYENVVEWEKVRGRWSRSLSIADKMREKGIWPLRTILSFNEIMVTASCRREWSDGRLRPMLGIPLVGLHDLYQFVVEFFVSFNPSRVDYIGEETIWTKVNENIYLNPECRAAAASIVEEDDSAVSLRIAASAPIAWVHRTWLYVGGTEVDIDERQAYDATLQRLFYLWNNMDVQVKGGSYSDGIVSLCWGIDAYRYQPTIAVGADKERKEENKEDIPLSSRLIPSCRHMTLHSVWRLLLYNVNRTCLLMREHAPNKCPFSKMSNAIQRRLDEVTGSNLYIESFQDEMLNVAVNELKSCSAGEVDMVCLIVGMVAYVRNMDNMRRRVSTTESTPFALQTYIQSTAQLVLGRSVDFEGESRMIEIICSYGDELMKRAGLRYYESCTWHPYSNFLYNM